VKQASSRVSVSHIALSDIIRVSAFLALPLHRMVNVVAGVATAPD
jgi:predicted membrane protein